MPLRYHRLETIPALGLALLLTACAGQWPVSPSPDDRGEVERPAVDTQPWIETDAVVAVDNGELEAHIRDSLLDIGPVDGLDFTNVTLQFSDPAIGLSISANVTGPDGEAFEATLRGEVTLSYGAFGLSWFPLLRDFSPDIANGGRSGDDWIRRINANLIRELVVTNRNRIGIGISPPEAIVLSARLPGFDGTMKERKFALQGAFTVAASRTRITSQATTIAVDLEFVEGISRCPSDFYVSRSTFAREIVNREPVGVGPGPDTDYRDWHYFTEVAEAPRNLTLVHYWFADGRPVGITELPVEPSARWRTWSSLPVAPGFARHIEVFAADRDSGCIVDVGHMEVVGPGNSGKVFAESFGQVTRPFPAARGRPGVATLELSREALAEAFNRSAGDTWFAIWLDAGEGERQSISASIDSLAGSEFNCQRRDCGVPTECRADFSRCQRRQDNRDCSTCLFRNPLNDRCMSEREDPGCEARKAQLNAQFGSAWEACMAREENAQRACEERGQEAIAVCEQNASAYHAACEANSAALSRHTGPVASLEGEVLTSGSVAVVYSRLGLSAASQRIKGLIHVEPDFRLIGRLEAIPGEGLGQVGQCLEDWDTDFQIQFDQQQVPRRLAGATRGIPGGLDIGFPGLTLPLEMDRGPLETMLTSDFDSLGRCALGLPPEQLVDRVSGENGLLLRGMLPLDLLPGPARIEIPAVEAHLRGKLYTSAAVGREHHFRFEMKTSSAVADRPPEWNQEK